MRWMTWRAMVGCPWNAELLGSIEQAQATAAVLQRLKQGNEALKVGENRYCRPRHRHAS